MHIDKNVLSSIKSLLTSSDKAMKVKLRHKQTNKPQKTN